MSKRKKKLVPFETIVLATQGDPQALEQVIRHYRPYILSLCRREYIAENGNVSIVCDNELKLRLEAKLMAKILLFDISNKEVWNKPMDQQAKAEAEWIEQLNRKYPVTINWKLVKKVSKMTKK